MNEIVVLGTGGTIAGVSRHADGVSAYAAAQVGLEALLAAVPAGDVTREALVLEQVCQLDSKDMDEATWRALVQRCAYWLAQPQVQGLVITHGTDTVEETAYFLHRVLAPKKPVVLTCAMRPATAPDADGPQNLSDALRVAADPRARGVCVVCAGEVHSALHVRKLHPTRLNAFSSGAAPVLARVHRGVVVWSLDGVTDGLAPDSLLFDRLVSSTPWPRVELLFSHALSSGALVDMLVSQDCARQLGVPPVQGLVVAGTGNGTVHQALEAALLRAQAAGVRVVRSRRPGFEDEAALSESSLGTALATLGPFKARVALMLDLIRVDTGEVIPVFVAK